MKIIFSGLESSGKSLKLAMLCFELVKRNSKWNRVTGRSRPIISNIGFKKDFEDYAKSMNVELKYWKNLGELVTFQEADIICDEVGNYFDSRGWENCTLDIRRWLTQGAKTGIEFYGAAQDFSQIDIAFRRLVQNGDLKFIRKIAGSRRPAATKPPVRRIWGICYAQSLDPTAYDEKNRQFAGGFLDMFIPTNYFFIRRRFCDIFDTQQKLARSEPPLYRHEVRFCELHADKGGSGKCKFCRVMHV